MTATELTGLLKQTGANIKALREQRGMSQAELARRSGISATRLNEIESKRSRDIRLSTLSVLSKSLNVSIAAIIDVPESNFSKQDQNSLLKASETITRIIRRIRSL
jgi:transcriptional regulator with XRE-family HTH domain